MGPERLLCLLGVGHSAVEAIVAVLTSLRSEKLSPLQCQVGLTDDPERRRREHGNPFVWRQFRMSSTNGAEFAENWLIKVWAMKGGTGGHSSGSFLYYFVPGSTARRNYLLELLTGI